MIRRELFSPLEINLGVEGDFLYLSENQITHFRDKNLFQVLYFPEKRPPQAKDFYFYYSLSFGDSRIRSDLLFLRSKNTSPFEVKKVRIGRMDEGNFFFFEYKEDDPEVSGFLLSKGNLQRLEWKNNLGFSFDWKERRSDGNIIGPVLMMGESEDVLFRSRVIFFRGRPIIQATVEENFDDSLSVDIFRILTRAEVESIFGEFTDLLRRNKNKSQHQAVDFCDFMQKKFSIFFPMFIV